MLWKKKSAAEIICHPGSGNNQTCCLQNQKLHKTNYLTLRKSEWLQQSVDLQIQLPLSSDVLTMFFFKQGTNFSEVFCAQNKEK